MKKIILFGLLFISLVIFAAAAPAAFEKGTKGMGGSFSFSGAKESKGISSIYSLAVNPVGSYFIADNLCIDLDLSLGLWWIEDSSKLPSYGIGIGGRYFVKRFYGGFSFFLNGHKSYYTRFTDIGPGDPNIPDVGTQWIRQSNLVLKLGHLFPVAKNVFLDAGLSYRIGLGNVSRSEGFDYENDGRVLSTRVGLAYYF